MTQDEANRRERALRFYGSERGRYITSQAFYRAIKAMEQDEFPEYSNIEDMKYLMENLFPVFPVLEKVMEQFKAQKEKDKENIFETRGYKNFPVKRGD